MCMWGFSKFKQCLEVSTCVGEVTAEKGDALVHQILSLHPLLKARQPQQGGEGHTAGGVWPKVFFNVSSFSLIPKPRNY